MLITKHLNDDELREYLFDGDKRSLASELGALRDQVQAAADQPEAFWTRQRAKVRARIQRTHGRSLQLRKFIWAGALASVLVGGMFLNRHSEPQVSQVRIDPDHDLLLAVEQAVQSGGPASLEPAALLADEMVQHAQPISKQKGLKKESRNEN